MDLKCSLCLDRQITEGTGAAADAVTIAPVLQSFTVNGQQAVTLVPLPVCADCRRKQLGPVSKTGLVTA